MIQVAILRMNIKIAPLCNILNRPVLNIYVSNRLPANHLSLPALNWKVTTHSFGTSSVTRQERSNLISFEEIHRLATNKRNPDDKTIILDVREPDELLGGKISNAENVPLSSFQDALKMDPVAFKSTYGFSKPTKDSHIILYCKAGQRSTVAAQIAKAEGYTEIRNYPGSWLEYSEKTQKNR